MSHYIFHTMICLKKPGIPSIKCDCWPLHIQPLALFLWYCFTQPTHSPLSVSPSDDAHQKWSWELSRAFRKADEAPDFYWKVSQRTVLAVHSAAQRWRHDWEIQGAGNPWQSLLSLLSLFLILHTLCLCLLHIHLWFKIGIGFIVVSGQRSHRKIWHEKLSFGKAPKTCSDSVN